MLVLLFFLRQAGVHIPPTTSIHARENAIYYWRTVFELSDKEKAFLKKENIRRIYLRMFDVTASGSMAIPNATITFSSPIPTDIDIVPTVFITVDALKQTAGDGRLEILAEKIVKRITAMCSWNDIPKWNEIQLDCDWTESTRAAFYILCSEVKKKAEGKLVSSTIRLHQLSQEEPPVDYGVLMVYNTDRFDDPSTENSILNATTVEKYVNKRLNYKLPLDIALPIYQWDIVFSGKEFRRIAHPFDGAMEEDEEIRHEQVPYSELAKTQQILNQYLNLDSCAHSTVLYHLDSTNIDNYTHVEIKSIYNH